MIKISLIIPIYNVEQYIYECLDSVVNQSLKEIEIICVNDGSEDASLTILEEFSKKDSRIKIITQKNQGLSAARNTGMMNIQGGYIYFLDSDDFFENKYVLEQLYSEAIKYDLDFIEGDFNFYFNNNKQTKSKGVDLNNVISGKELHKISVQNKLFGSVVWNKLFKTKFLLKNNLTFINGIIYEDIDFTYRCYNSAEKVKHLNLITVNYRQRENSITSDLKIHKINDYFVILNSIREFNFRKGIDNRFSNYILGSLILEILYKSNYLSEKEKVNIFSQISLRELFLSFNFPYIFIGIIYSFNKNIALYLLKKIKGH